MLRSGQKELVTTYRKGYCGVPAIPGGGKTFALTQWAVEVITEGANLPGKILIVTYMGSAAGNFKQRIAAELEKRGISSRDYYVSTIHSLCLQIIKDKPEIVGINSEVDVIADSEKNNLIKEAFLAWKRKEENSKLYLYYLDEVELQKKGYDKLAKTWDNAFCSLMANAISNFKTNEITPKSAIRKTEKLKPTSLLKVAAKIYEEYERKLRRRGMIDFEDMLSKAKFILENDEAILKKYRNRYTYVCEDEAQDSNKLQSEILKLIAGENGNFLRVGDSNQAITTTFANSDMKLFKEFCEDKNTKVFHITKSSRNTKQIIDTANRFVKFVRENHPTAECRESLLPQYIETVDEDDLFPNPVVEGDGVFYNEVSKEEDEYEAIADKCEELISKFPDKTTAVLLFSSTKISKLLSVFETRKIPYESLDNSSNAGNMTLKKLGTIIDFIAKPEDNSKLIAIMEVFLDEELPFRKEILEYFKYVNIEEIFYPILGEISKNGLSNEILKSKTWTIALDVIEKLKDFLEFPFTVYEKIVVYVAERLEFSREEMAIAQKVASGIKFLAEENLRYTLSDLAFELLKNKNSFNYFANLVWDLKGYEAKKGVVTVCTYHKSKGLEWDNVLLGSLVSRDFPTLVTENYQEDLNYLKNDCKNPSAMMKADFADILGEDTKKDFAFISKCNIIGERARLLYVGITRAKERLFISGVRNSKTKISRYFDFLSKGV